MTFGLEDRLNGYKKAMEEAGLPYEDYICIFYDSQLNMMEAGYIQLNLILSKAKTDAVIAKSDMYAIGAMRVRQQRKESKLFLQQLTDETIVYRRTRNKHDTWWVLHSIGDAI